MPWLVPQALYLASLDLVLGKSSSSRSSSKHRELPCRAHLQMLPGTTLWTVSRPMQQQMPGLLTKPGSQQLQQMHLLWAAGPRQGARGCQTWLPLGLATHKAVVLHMWSPMVAAPLTAQGLLCRVPVVALLFQVQAASLKQQQAQQLGRRIPQSWSPQSS
jgi:hypothetical protein